MAKRDPARAPRSVFRKAAIALFGTGVPSGLIVMVLLLVAVMAAYAAVSYWMTPWAHASSDRQALVGYWQGEIGFGPGDTRHIALRLRKFTTLSDILLDKSGTRGVAAPDIRVAAKICGPKDAMQYHGSGDVKNREGTRFTFGIEPNAGVPGKHPSEFEAVWDGENRLELTARLHMRTANGATGEAAAAARPGGSKEPGVIRLELRRSTEEEFVAAC
jgi:hypothetical protein